MNKYIYKINQLNIKSWIKYLIDKKISGGSGGSGELPSEYTQINSIIGNRPYGSIGTYIDTGIKPNQDTKIEMKIINSTSYAYWFGCWNEGYNDGAYAIGNDGRQIYMGYDGQGGGFTSILDGNEHTIIFDKNIVYVDDVIRKQFDYREFQVNYNLFLFCQNRKGSPSWGDHSDSQVFSLYYCKIYNNNKLIRDFIPVERKSDNIKGLFDLVTQEFYVNKGNGSF